MPRASKRESVEESTPSVKIARLVSSKAVRKVQDRTTQLYDKYADEKSGVIEPQGIMALCSDLKVDHTDVRILMFAWKTKAQKQGYFTLDEWRRGFKALQVDTINKFKKALPGLEKQVLKPENFMDFYDFSFRYCLTEDRQKCLDIESMCTLMDMVLGSQYRRQVDCFIEFLKIQSDYKGMNLDQWKSFLRFCQEIRFPGLENYDCCGAWPVILDNFVEWMKANGTSP